MAAITVQEFATELNTDPRTARKFLREVTPKDAQPGKGKRWSIERRDLRSLKSKFSKFIEAEQAARQERELARQAEKAKKTKKAGIIEVDGVKVAEVDFDSLEGPTDEELAALEG